MNLFLRCMIVLCAAGLLPWACRGQVADVPSAPMPQTPAGLNLKAPAVSPVVEKPVDSKKPENPCDESHEGIYALENSVDQSVLDHSYLQTMQSRILTNYDAALQKHRPANVYHGYVTYVRFAINPDGSFYPPELVRSSGNADDDEKLIAAIRTVRSFPPLPATVHKPVRVCIHFGYNVSRSEVDNGESWLDKVVAKDKK